MKVGILLVLAVVVLSSVSFSLNATDISYKLQMCKVGQATNMLEAAMGYNATSAQVGQIANYTEDGGIFYQDSRLMLAAGTSKQSKAAMKTSTLHIKAAYNLYYKISSPYMRKGGLSARKQVSN
ncbi:hypothetical protein H0O00_04005, partial [Candidatus Micrarchaeota archaeon]|nr:hypothetical protein [Candidatus Micrarchaeota archaeon]